jgi:hypothetical protein
MRRSRPGVKLGGSLPKSKEEREKKEKRRKRRGKKGKRGEGVPGTIRRR